MPLQNQLHWQKQGPSVRLAETKTGTYRTVDAGAQGLAGFGTSFRPVPGKGRKPQPTLSLGNLQTLEKAMARCEQHYADRKS